MTILTNNCAPLAATSGNVAAAVATATLPGTPGRMTYITGFQVTGSGQTGGPTIVDVTVGPLGTPGSTTLHYELTSVIGVTLSNQPLLVQFDVPLPALTVGASIAVTCPSLGAGSTNSAVNAIGYCV